MPRQHDAGTMIGLAIVVLVVGTIAWGSLFLVITAAIKCAQ